MKIVSRLLDWIAPSPSACRGCGRPAAPPPVHAFPLRVPAPVREFLRRAWCRRCAEALTWLDEPLDARCGCPPASRCAVCAGELDAPFCAARSAVAYNPFLRDVLIRYKFRGDEALEEPLAALLAAAVAALPPPGRRPDCVAYVPLHPDRARGRGFNQAQRLARRWAARAGVPVRELLVRVAWAAPQSRQVRRVRMRVASDAFALAAPAVDLAGRRVLLVDDVYTTGVTAARCAAVLRDAGAEVYVATVARTLSPVPEDASTAR